VKIILLQDVKKLGKRGDLVEVAEGYARNFLFPRKLAAEATQGSINQLEQEKSALKRKKAKELEAAKVLAKKLSNTQLTLSVKAGDQGKLFGSITNKDISEALEKQHQVTVDRRKIELGEPIKALGTYEVAIKLVPEVEAKLVIKVVEG
jgi:large subunit ribosomal protein L9